MTYPITPPPELVGQWFREAQRDDDPDVVCWMQATAKRAAQWGADQELEACCEWFVRDWTDVKTADKLRAARRPKPLSLKERAQQALSRFDCNAHTTASEMVTDFALIRSALDALPDD